MNRRGWEIILPRDLASPVTGIIQGKKNLQRKQMNLYVQSSKNETSPGLVYTIK